jgi:hypothetical protein
LLCNHPPELRGFKIDDIIASALEQYAHNGLFFYELDYASGLKVIKGPEKEPDISKRHVMTPTNFGLGVKSVILLRDLEYNSHEKGANKSTDPVAAALAAKEHDSKVKYAYDTLHVLAVPGDKL